MSIQQLLGDTPQGKFVEEHYLKLPFSRPGGCRDFCHLGTWETLGSVLADATADVMVVKANQRVSAPSPRSAAEAQRLSDEGCTVFVRKANRHHPELAELAAAFQRDFCGEVDIHIYATPPGHHGFGWHYDAEEVFLLQTMGVKDYSLRKNTVNPWPLIETLPADMRYEREIMPLARCRLAAGDWLYLPAGYWHKAEASGADEAAISLSIGIAAPAAIRAFDALRPALLESLLWRQRLPVMGAASLMDDEQLIQALCEIGRQLGQDLSRTLTQEAFWQAFIASLRGRGEPS